MLSPLLKSYVPDPVVVKMQRFSFFLHLFGTILIFTNFYTKHDYKLFWMEHFIWSPCTEKTGSLWGVLQDRNEFLLKTHALIFVTMLVNIVPDVELVSGR